MTTEVESDIDLLDILRKAGPLTVSQMESLMGVTATAVRQRLNRLLAHRYIEREAVVQGRGRPSHRYLLTTKGRRKTGENFGDLSVALWEEIRAIEDPEIRKGLIQRLSHRLAEKYADQIDGETTAERMASVVNLLADRRVPFRVELRDGQPVLLAESCPYPELAEHDRSVCAMERMMLSELIGDRVKLGEHQSEDGDCCCSFEVDRELNHIQGVGKETTNSNAS
jgi:DeoR family suf operon transcriptional repressor